MVGIDPGQSGGIVKLDNATGAVIVADKFEGKTDHDIAELIREYACSDGACETVFIELVGPSRGQDDESRRQGVSSAFRFGDNNGFLRGCIVMAHIPLRRVAPVVWQKALGVTRKSKDESRTELKNRHKAEAQRRWPNHKWTHAIADAALIAEYGRITRQ